MRTEHYLFYVHVLEITPKSNTKVCSQCRIIKQPGSLLVTVLKSWFRYGYGKLRVGVGLKGKE